MRGLFDVDAGARELGVATTAPPPMPQIEEDSAPIVSSRQAEHLADFADRRAAAVGNDGRGDAGALAAVACR